MAVTEKTELADILAYGVDLKNRRIYFGVNLDVGDVDSSTEFSMSSVEYAVRALHRMASDAPGKPIEIHMNSEGGDAYAMLRLYDEIRSCPCQVKFFGSGSVCSAATWIMAGCDERYLHINTTVMVHDGSEGFDGKHTDSQIYAEEMKRLQSLLCQIYAENSRMPAEFWLDISQRDTYLTASEAVSLGLADKVLEPKKRGNLRKMRQHQMKKEVDPKEFKQLVKSIYKRIGRIEVPKIELNEPAKELSDPHLTIAVDPLPAVDPPKEEMPKV